MRSYNGYSDEFDDVEGFAYDRSRSLQKLVKDARREERHSKRFRSSAKDRHHLDNWDWDDDDDWESFNDDSSLEYSEDLNRYY